MQAGSGPAQGLDRCGPGEVLAALSAVRQGRIIELGTTLGRDMPQGNPDAFYGFRVTQYRTPRALTSRASPGFDFSMDVITASPHLGTHIDGLAHISCHGRMYGGHELADVYGDFGWQVNGMEHSRPVLTRGLLLDVAAAKGVAHLPDRYAITPEDLEATLRAQGGEVHAGDAVLVRTGWMAAWYASDPDRYFASQPGVGPDAALWLYERGMAILGTDTSGTEVIPMPDPERTTHGVMLVERGVHLIEIMDLEAVAAEGIHEFAFACLPLRITGATGSWLRPVAIICERGGPVAWRTGSVADPPLASTVLYPGLRDRVVLVTGAARGLGRALANAFAAQGCRLALGDVDEAGLGATSQELEAQGAQVHVEVLDLDRTDACEPFVARVVERFGRLDVLVNNAAVIERMPFEDVTAAGFERLLRVNLLAPFFLARAAIGHMRRQGGGGRIVNVASMAARTGGIADVPMYAASKGALIAVTKSLAKAVAADGILVNAILPSNIDSPMLRDVFAPEAVARTLGQVPLGRAADPSEVAALVLWLASDASSYVTGVNWDINGGWYMT